MLIPLTLVYLMFTFRVLVCLSLFILHFAFREKPLLRFSIGWRIILRYI